MEIKETNLQGCFIIKPTIFTDHRGSFFECYNHQKLEKKLGVKVTFVQDNQSFSKRGVVRGLHFQKGKFSQAKLVRVITGKVLDVVVDIRPNSTTFGKYFSILLSAENNIQVFIPKGFAHGFSVLENATIFSYKCDNYYNKKHEGGIIYNDSKLNINWMLSKDEIILSEKDKTFKQFSEILK